MPPFSPLQPFSFLFFPLPAWLRFPAVPSPILFEASPRLPINLDRSWQRLISSNIFHLPRTNYEYFLFVTSDKTRYVKVFRNRARRHIIDCPSCSLGRLGRKGRGREKQMAPRWLDLSIHLNKSTVGGNPLAVAHPPSSIPLLWRVFHFCRGCSNSGHLFLRLFFKCLPMEIVIIL